MTPRSPSLEDLGLHPRPGETYEQWSERFDTAVMPQLVSLARLAAQVADLQAAGQTHHAAIAIVAGRHRACPDHLARLLQARHRARP